MTGHARGARGGVRERAEDLDGGGLARAVRPEEAEGLSPGHLEVDAAHGLDLTVLLGQAGGGYDRPRPPVVPARLVASHATACFRAGVPHHRCPRPNGVAPTPTSRHPSPPPPHPPLRS